MAEQFHGWIRDDKAVELILQTTPKAFFADVRDLIKGTGKDKIVLLYKYVEALLGHFNVRRQAIGDCVSFGAATVVDCLKATEIVLHGEFEEWIAETSTEDIYGGSRVQIGGGRLGSGDGSIGAWAARYVRDYGTLVRKKYNNGFDLTTYSGARARDWGMPNRGTPSELIAPAREHKVLTVSQILTVEDARDAVANGYPITIASNQGFTSSRDSEGFARASGSWAHQMAIIGVDDKYRRPGFLVMNSWGPSWINGPKRHEQPDGSFWADYDVIATILRQQDSWAFSNFDGYKPQELDIRKLLFG